MDNIARLIKLYKPLVKSGNKMTFSEMCSFLEENMSAVKIDFNLISEITRRMMKVSIGHYLRENKPDLSLDKLQFAAYEIPREGKGAEYYNYPHISQIVEGHDHNSIYVILEKHIDYINCNCNKLFLDLTIKRGVSEYDYENNTMRLIEYLSRIEALEQKWY